MKYDFFFIPGLGMNADEVSLTECSLGLQNPGFSAAMPEKFAADYTLEDVADLHIENILSSFDGNRPLTLSGMSLGGMVLSIIATKHRHHLPKDTRYIFYVTSANSKHEPLISKETLKVWASAKAGSAVDFAGILRPFFSSGFLNERPEDFSAYVDYRTFGRNGQSPKSYFLQLGALLKFDGNDYFNALDPSASTFVFGAEDSIVNADQARRLKVLAPNATHLTIPRMGHMINMERPEIIGLKGKLDEIRSKSL